ncbi:MAG: hypothetical protein R2939_20230 [Kofleriaceae bacterium]
MPRPLPPCALVLAALLASAAPSRADIAPAPPAPTAPATTGPSGAGTTAIPLTPTPQRFKDQPRAPKPSGFWGSGLPSKHGAYRWRMMLVGAAVLALTVALTVRFLRRKGRERLAR